MKDHSHILFWFESDMTLEEVIDMLDYLKSKYPPEEQKHVRLILKCGTIDGSDGTDGDYLYLSDVRPGSIIDVHGRTAVYKVKVPELNIDELPPEMKEGMISIRDDDYEEDEWYDME